MRFLRRCVLGAALAAAALGGTTGCESPGQQPGGEQPWPLAPCRTPEEMLQVIEDRANAAKTASPPPSAPVLQAIEEVLLLVPKCRANLGTPPYEVNLHFGRVGAAMRWALSDEWMACRNELDHGH
jgi:hypothetical protein